MQRSHSRLHIATDTGRKVVSVNVVEVPAESAECFALTERRWWGRHWLQFAQAGMAKLWVNRAEAEREAAAIGCRVTPVKIEPAEWTGLPADWLAS